MLETKTAHKKNQKGYKDELERPIGRRCVQPGVLSIKVADIQKMHCLLSWLPHVSDLI